MSGGVVGIVPPATPLSYLQRRPYKMKNRVCC
jgi:hypothetical protein